MKSFTELRPSLVTRYQQLLFNAPTDAAYSAAAKILALLKNETYQTPKEIVDALTTLMHTVLWNKAESMYHHSPEWHEYWTIMFGYLEYLSYELNEFSMSS